MRRRFPGVKGSRGAPPGHLSEGPVPRRPPRNLDAHPREHVQAVADAPKEHAVVQAALLYAKGPRRVPVERDATQGRLSLAERHCDVNLRCFHRRAAGHSGRVLCQ